VYGNSSDSKATLLFRGIFHPFWIKLGTEDVNKHLLADCEFHENRLSENHTLLS